MAKPGRMLFTDVRTVAGVEYDSASLRKRSQEIGEINKGLSSTLSRYLVEVDKGQAFFVMFEGIQEDIQDWSYETYFRAVVKSYSGGSAWDKLHFWVTDSILKSREAQLKEQDFLRQKAVFMALPDDVKKQYAGKFVAIHGGKIVDSDYEESKLIERFYKNLGKATVYIDKIEETKPVIHIPTPLEIL